ncbi:MAG: ABC transporter ATP-binding protein [Hyphomicrobiaceae bacterium]
MAEVLLAAEGLVKQFGGLTATDNLSLEVRAGEIHALIGPNGAGKTTVVSQLSGMLAPSSGRILFEGRDITRLAMPARVRLGLARSFQITSVLKDFTALDNVALAVQAHRGHSFRFWTDFRKDEDLRVPARRMLDLVDLGPRADTLAARLSHGEQRQLEIAMAMAEEPKVLLLDEPMAGMGPEESSRLVKLLQSIRGRHAILLVEHDMDAVFALADRITVLVYGRAIATGTADEIRQNPEVRSAYLGEEDTSAFGSGI